MKLALLGSALSIALTSAAAAATFSPGDAAVAVSPAFGGLVAGGELGTNYNSFGVDFSYGNVEGIFDDGGGVLAFGGVTGGVVDLLSAIDGMIVLEGTGTQAVTDYFYAEAGFADIGTLTLELFDSGMNLIASVLNDLPLGANGRTTFSYSGAGIAYFSIFGSDSFGVNEISLNTPTALAAVPLPAGGLMLLGGLGLLAAARRRNRA